MSFMEQVTEALLTGNVMLERQTCMFYTKDEKVVVRAVQSAYFSVLKELRQANELESRKTKIKITQPFLIGIAVYQLAKLRMLEFYYDRRDFKLIKMDTDSNFIAIYADRLEDIVCPDLRAEFKATKKQWLAWDKWSGRTHGLFQLKCEGSRMLALCWKCYHVDEQDSESKRASTKGMSKRYKEITWQRFEEVLKGSIKTAEN